MGRRGREFLREGGYGVGVGDVGEKPDIVEGVGDALDGEEGEDALVALVFVKARCEGVL